MTNKSIAENSSLALPLPESSFWARIANEIADSIRRGIYPPGQKLPSETALAQHYDVNRHTIRRSLATLGQLGLVRSTQGSGTYVEDFAVDLILGKRTRHRQSLKQAGLKGGMSVLSVTTEAADTGVAQALQIRRGGRVLHLVVLGEGGGHVLHISDRYFPLPRFAGLELHLQESGSITESFLRLGVEDYTRKESRISARLPDTEIASLLQQPATRPALQVTSVNVDTEGIPLEFARTWFAGDRVTLTVNHEHDE
ncbi:phosphonate metabolism transcriptional regulator PhnF [Comamonas sp. NoAH]|uniref:phosphonate metabolism transcriptional regulator PhnF n=1 Tax=Comamonas halotolerans TaxID=3041496 RepID=UPI0024E15303|nr:phosphonate metabolism transcriptional regulator PhnF [Comamonas sp. NoAH]